MNWNDGTYAIRSKFVSVYPELRNSLIVTDLTSRYNNQRNISLSFLGFMPTYNVYTNPSTPLLGQTPTISIVNGPVSTGDLWWSPIPYEFLY